MFEYWYLYCFGAVLDLRFWSEGNTFKIFFDNQKLKKKEFNKDIIYVFNFCLYRSEDEGGGFSQNLEIVPETEREFIAR
jgi:hypothetical protein